ncbi:MAG TPA: TonB-dependent receptor [Terracidiphilus sp.]|nr:TonB-dependent receptor [Terracidiphilus sp.]
MKGRPTDVFQVHSSASRFWMLASALLAVFVLCGTASAQVLYGSISGTVSDNSGAVIPNVGVTISNQATGEVRTVKANGNGSYNLLDVLPGTYTLSIPQAGNFGGYTQKNIGVEVNQQVRIDIALQPASVSQQITVTEAPPELQTETAEVDSDINQTQISELPITSSKGRNYEELYTLIPGAAQVQEKNSIGGNPSRALSVNVNGNSYNGNTTRIDGAIDYYGWLPYLIAYVTPADAVESVTVTTDDFNAEQGQAGGASVRVTTKSGGHDFHGGGWWYYQDAAVNARAYLNTPQVQPTIPKNINQEFGGNIGGPVYIPHILTGKKKLFFFTNFDRITQRSLASAPETVPDALMNGGNFSEAAPYATLYDPQPQAPGWQGQVNPALCPNPNNSYTNGYLQYQCRPSFTAEYGETGANVNTIPASRISLAGGIMMQDLLAISKTISTPSATQLSKVMLNDYQATSTVAYNRNSSDTKITYIPTENTQVFGKYGVTPYTDSDPQVLGNTPCKGSNACAGGPAADGGQVGNIGGRGQNAGLGVSHVFSSNLVIDADFGFTRLLTYAQSTLDVAVGDYGLNTLKIPGTNGPGLNYVGIPGFYFGPSSAPTFTGLGNNQGANPFEFRDNQFTGDVNLSWLHGHHAFKFGYTYYHFDLNHFQPTSGGQPNTPRGGFTFAGGMTCGNTNTATTTSCTIDGYNDLADFLLGLPNNGSGQAIGDPSQVFNPNALRWSEDGVYAQDTWTVTPKLTLTYGIRYEVYPAPYRDRTGASVLLPQLPQSANVEVGGINGNPRSAGIGAGWGQIVPRFGIAYRLNDQTVVRTGFGLTTDPDSMRYLRDSFPEDLAPSYGGTGNFTIAVDPANGNAPMNLTYGIPSSAKQAPNYSTGFASLPIAGSTNTVPQNFRRGYIESWNLVVQRTLPMGFVGTVGYVGDHFVRQQVNINYLNAANFPTSSSPCMPNGQFSPTSGYTGACSFTANETINIGKPCPPTATGTAQGTCYNTGGITFDMPLWSSGYNGLQTQLTRNAGTNASLGVVYTYSHAIDYEDNGAGSGSGGTTFNYPAFYRFNRGSAGFDEKHNLQVWGVYSLPFGPGQMWMNHGVVGDIIGGWQLSGQFSHFSGFPFSINANSNTIGGFAPGFGATYAQLTGSYKQLGGHAQSANSPVSGGKPWFDPSSFSSPAESAAAPVIPNTGRNQWRGPGNTQTNASLVKNFKIWREAQFQFRFEAFNVFNHPWLNAPNTTVGSGTFGYISNFNAFNVAAFGTNAGSRQMQFSGRVNF